MNFKPQSEKNYLIVIIYKLLNDLLFIWLVFFFLALIAEGIIPGVVSDYISFLKILLVAFFLFLSACFLGKLTSFEIKNQKKKPPVFLFSVLTLTVLNSLRDLNLILALFVSVAVISAAYFIYKIILEKES